MPVAKLQRCLAEQEFFAALAPESVAFLAECARPRQLERNQSLFHHGDRARHFFLIRSGRIAREVPAIQGPTLLLEDLGPGEVIGWSWLIAPYRWSFEARATEPADLLEFDGACVLARCEAEPAFGYEILKRFAGLMSRRLMHARQRMLDAWAPAGFA
jgi:CRP/FNR family transcriptional regulator, cyclic AMP receptor protein